ncbi:hypothetical protein [Arthrobacter sp. ISL-5]|uniref:hypothetical protein n=1 Tax=Arthrobacter sp. ISL-5 TaxID=2819111 RepID=UPI001BE7409B|nr:hypothetical protein [Arthrobacter sp. ISL-5]MBT2554598.1 hypothetical protein [Arthrobacter sp. ISL-5]
MLPAPAAAAAAAAAVATPNHPAIQNFYVLSWAAPQFGLPQNPDFPSKPINEAP